jgi:hypothetical protein
MELRKQVVKRRPGKFEEYSQAAKRGKEAE